MPRKLTSAVKVHHVPGHQPPWKVSWRKTVGTARKTTSKFCGTEQEARDLQTAIEAQLRTLPAGDPYLPKKTPTVVVLTDRPEPGTAVTLHAFREKLWTPDIVSQRKAGTQAHYDTQMNLHILPHIGQKLITNISRQDVIGLITKARAHGLSWGSQQAVVRVLSAALDYAVALEHIKVNVAENVTKRMKPADEQEPEPNPMTVAQMSAFLEWCLSDESWWHPYFATLYKTGMRRGEACGWMQTDLNLPKRRATIARQMSSAQRTRDRKRGIESQGLILPKTGRIRDIDLARSLIAILKPHIVVQKKEGLRCGRPVSPFVFTLPLTGEIIPSNCSTADRVFHRGMKAIGAEQEAHTIHDIRDTFATTHLLRDPRRLAWVSAMLGHRKVRTTLDRYTKWVPSLTDGQAFVDDQEPVNVPDAAAVGDE